MKCRYCNTEIKQGAKFCPNCGKEVLDNDICFSCGKKIKTGAKFCPHCGANQDETIESIQHSNTSVEEQPPQMGGVSIQHEEVPIADESREENVHTQQFDDTIEVERNGTKKEEVIESPKESIQESQQEDLANTLQPYEETKSKKGIWILLAILLLCAIAGAGYYFFDKSSGDDSYVATSDTIDTVVDSSDIHSIEGIKARLNDIFTKALSMPDDVAVSKYFSQEFKQLYSQVEKIDDTFEEGPGFWNGSIWDGSQDDNPNGYKIVRVNTSSPLEAYVDVELLSDYEKRHSEQTVSMSLVFENDNWFIDDILDGRHKDEMKEYIKRNNSPDSYSYVGKVYKGGGNGGGLNTEMTISFIDDNQCTCVSDWYQAYSSPKTLKGQYEIKNNTVVVKCKDGDTEFLFEFEMKSNGRILEFDHSDPDMEGTIGNDYMSLEVQ